MLETNLMKKLGYTLPSPPVVDANTLMLINVDNGVIKDLSSKAAVITNSNVTIDNSNTLFNSPTMRFNTSYLSVPSPSYLALGTADWTVDVYYNVISVIPRPSDSTRHMNFAFWGRAGGGSNPLNIDLEYLEDSYGYNNLWTAAWQTTSVSSAFINTATGRIIKSKWCHLIYQQRAGMFSVRINGALVAPAVTAAINLQERIVRPMYLGYQNDTDGNFTNAWYFNGNLAWYRWSNIARYPNT